MSQASLKARIDKAYQEIAELDRQIGALENRRTQARTRLAKLQGQLEAAEAAQ